MKTRKHFVVVGVVLVLVAGLLAQATMSEGDDETGFCIKEAFPAGKITDRPSFVAGALFAQQEVGPMRYKEIVTTPREAKDLLAGRHGVGPFVDEVDPKVAKYGLTRGLLQTDTELRLRQHGIRVLTAEEGGQIYGHDLREQEKKSFETLKPMLRSFMESITEKDSDEHLLQSLSELIRHRQEGPWAVAPCLLYIKVNPLVSEESACAAFSIRVELQDEASLCRNGASCLAATWQTGAVGLSSLSHLKEKVRESLRDRLDEFINAYLAANPQDRSSEEKK